MKKNKNALERGAAGKILWIMRTAFKYCFAYIAVSILLVLLTSFIGFMLNLLNKNMVNELAITVLPGKLSAAFVGIVAAYIMLYLFNWASQFLRVFGNNFFRLNVDMLFQKIFMWKTYKTPQERFFDREFAEKHSFALSTAPRVSNYINMWIQFIFGLAASFIGTIVIFAIYEPWLIVYVLFIGAANAALITYISKKQYILDKKQIHEQRFADYYKSLLTNKKEARELRIYKTQEHFYSKWTEVYNKLRKENVSLSLEHTRLKSLVTIARFVFRTAAVLLLSAGAYLGRYDIGTFVMLFGMIETCANQVNNIVDMLVRGTYRDVKYLCDYYDYISPISDCEINELRGNLKEHNENSTPFGDFDELNISGVSYTYPNGAGKAVDNVSLTVHKGEIVSILGYNGSGKTTLSKLMNGSLIPQEGCVTLNGIKLCEENKESFFNYFGIAPQDFSRFSLSVRELVGLGRMSEMDNDAALSSAYEKAGVEDFIDKYDAGDRTVLGKEYDEQGVDLSGGEWQKLIIASAYLGTPEILLMDEPSASIDPLKELELLANLRKNLEGKTAVLISHRIGFARLADRIVMMEKGRITETGTHEELLLAGGGYARLFSEQKKLYEEGE